jgi:serine/threonine protein phosphatase PrpC
MDGINISEPTSAGVGSAFLLCTDGWWEYVTERDMEETYKNSSNIHDWLKRMIEIREENAPEDSDNYTAIVVMI